MKNFEDFFYFCKEMPNFASTTISFYIQRTMSEKIYTPAEVAKAIQRDISENLQISVAEAAKHMGKEAQTLYNIFRGKSRISLAMAKRMSEAFGYSVKFLTSGVGELREEDRFVIRLGEGENQHAHVLGPEDSLVIDGEYYPRQRIRSPREKILQRYCKLYFEILSALAEHGILELDYSTLEDPKVRDYNFIPQSSAESDMFCMLSHYLTKINQLTDLHRIVESLDAIKDNQD